MRNRGYQMKGLSTSSASALVAIFVLILFLGTVSIAQPLEGPFRDGTFEARSLDSNTATVNVTVTDDQERPMHNAEVRLLGGSNFWTTDENGSAQITGLYANDTAPGTSYNFTATVTGYRSTVTQAWILGNATNNVTIIVEGGTVLGTVSSQGGPLKGVNVSITALGYFNITDLEGKYRLSGIPAGTHSVTAARTGYDSKTATATLSVAGVYLCDFSLTPLNGTISGSVSNEAATPLVGANLTITVGLKTVIVSTNESGAYELPDIPEGTYSVTASLNGFYSATKTNVSVTRGNRTDNVNFTLYQKPNKIYGVVKARTLLLPGVNISIMGTSFYNISDYEGSYQITNISAGMYNISAYLDGYKTSITPVTILAGTDLLLNIDLSELPGSQLLVRVSEASTGDPLVGVVITISGNGMDPQRQSTNIDGKFAFTGLDPGNYTLQLVKDGFKPVELQKITLGEGQNQTVTVTMEPLRESNTGFIFGFDMAHSMMILALFLTIVILAMAVWLRIKTFQTPENAPAVYDEEPEKTEEGEEGVEEPAPTLEETPNGEKPENGKKN